MIKSFLKVFLSMVLLSGFLPAVAGDRPPVGGYVQAYTGEENVVVYITRLGTPDKAEVLLVVSGIDSPLNGVVQKAKVVNDGQGHRSYHVKSDKEEYEILRLDRSNGRLFMSVYPHGLNEYRVGYSPDLSRDANAELLLTQWLDQKSGKR